MLHVYRIGFIKPNANALPAFIGLFSNSGFGNYKALSLYKFASFLNAAKDPVKVTAPIKTPKKLAIVCKASG